MGGTYLLGRKKAVMHTKKYSKPLRIAVIVVAVVLGACLVAYGWQQYEEKKYPEGTEKNYKLPNAFLDFAQLISDFIHQNDEVEEPKPEQKTESGEHITKIVVGSPDDTDPSEEIPVEPIVIGGTVEEQEPVSDDAFQNTVFIGDYFVSEAKTLGYFPKATYVSTDLDLNTLLTRKSFKVDGEATTLTKYVESLQDVETIYVMLSPESVSWMDYPTFVKKYMTLLDEVKKAQPNAEIYVQPLFPINEELAQKRSYSVTNKEIDQINDYLEDTMGEREIWYLAMTDLFKTKDGDLSAEQTTNGIRLNADLYEIWYQYIITHKMVYDKP